MRLQILQVHHRQDLHTTLNLTENKSTHSIFFFDYKAAFDSPIRDRVIAAKSELCVNAKLIRLCTMTLGNSCRSVKVGMDLPESFNAVRNFRQGDPLWGDLFHFVMESTLRNAGVHHNGTIFQKVSRACVR